MSSAGGVSVYATSDLHAHWELPAAGIGRVLGVLADRDAASSVLIDNGDLLTGSVLGAHLASGPWDAGHPLLAMLEAEGFDVAVPGNHDLDHGAERLRAAVARLTTLRYVCANLVDATTGETVFAPSCVLERGGLRVGVIGAITGHLQRLSRYAAVRGVRALDPVAAVADEAARLRPGVDVLVVAYHGGFTEDPATAAPWHYDTGEDQAAKMLRIPGVDGLVAGHQHTVRSGIVDGTAYAQPGYAGSHIARLDFGADGRALAATATPTADAFADPEHPLAARDRAARSWCDEIAPLEDAEVHEAVAARAGVSATRLELPPAPRSWGALAAAFPGIYGASVLELPRAEAAGLPGVPGLGGPETGGPETGAPGTGDEAPVSGGAGDTLFVANAPVVDAAPPGRVARDLVVDWLDEFVWTASIRKEPRAGAS